MDEDNNLPKNAPGIAPGINLEALHAAPSWPRYWSRMVDITFCAAVAALLFGAIVPSAVSPGGWASAETKGEEYRLTVMFSFFGVFLDAAIYSVFGTTIGKYVNGIEVVHVQNRKLSFFEYAKRNVQVFFFGLGLGIPVVQAITCYVSKQNAENPALGARWDRLCATKVYTRIPPSENGARLVASAAIFFLLIGGLRVLDEWASRVEKSSDTASPTLEKTVETYEEKMQRMAAEIKPTVLNDATQLDKVTFGPGNVLKYSYTLYTSDVSSVSKNDIDEYVDNLRLSVVKDFCETLREELVNHQTKIIASYQDKNKRAVGEVSVLAADCNK